MDVDAFEDNLQNVDRGTGLLQIHWQNLGQQETEDALHDLACEGDTCVQTEDQHQTYFGLQCIQSLEIGHFPKNCWGIPVEKYLCVDSLKFAYEVSFGHVHYSDEPAVCSLVNVRGSLGPGSQKSVLGA